MAGRWAVMDVPWETFLRESDQEPLFTALASSILEDARWTWVDEGRLMLARPVLAAVKKSVAELRALTVLNSLHTCPGGRIFPGDPGPDNDATARLPMVLVGIRRDPAQRSHADTKRHME